jgi:hypothetical protein
MYKRPDSTDGYHIVPSDSAFTGRFSWTSSVDDTVGSEHRVYVMSTDSHGLHSPVREVVVTITDGPSVVEQTACCPADFALRALVPNPMISAVRVAYDLPAESHVRVRIFDAGGRVVATLVDGRRDAGAYTSTWDGADTRGARVPAGVYVCRMEAGLFMETKKIVLAR